MLDEENMSTLVNEIMSRLLMMDEDFEYEFDVPGRKARLGITGGAKQSRFLITPIDMSNGSPVEKPARSFVVRSGSVLISEHDPAIEMYCWLQAEPWAPAPTPVVFCECGCQATPGCMGNCRRPVGHVTITHHFCGNCFKTWEVPLNPTRSAAIW